MKTFLNQSQLARRLDVPFATLKVRLESGDVRPDAVDGLKRPLFELRSLQKIRGTLAETYSPRDVVCT